MSANKQSSWTNDVASLVTSGTDKEIRKLFKEMTQSRQWRGRRTGSGHIALRHESGGTTTIAGTPSDARTVRNTISDIRRAQKVGMDCGRKSGHVE